MPGKDSAKIFINSPTESLPKNALLLSKKQWSDIKKHLRPNEIELLRRQQELAYEKYLRNGSRTMTTKWENSIQKIDQRRNDERKKLEQEKQAEVERCLRELKENDEKNRKERILYAENLLKRLKPGPKQLESAYMLSKILHEQQLQREARRQREKLEREQELNVGRQRNAQAVQWIADQQQQMKAYKKQCARYKQVIWEDIEKREKEKLEIAKKMTELELREREANEKQLNCQLEKERAASNHRREQLRLDATLAKQHAEQQRRDEIIKNNDEQRRINEYLALKSEQELKRKIEKAAIQKQCAQFRNKLATTLFRNLPDIEGAEDKCYRHAVDAFAMQWKQNEEKRLENARKQKNERIKNHLEAIDKSKQLKENQLLEQYADQCNRLSNEKINLLYDRQQRLEKLKKDRELRQAIVNQIEQQIKSNTEMDTTRTIIEETQRDDQYFLNYAKRLINDGMAKGRPVYPLTKVVKEYQMHHVLLPPKDDLPHLKSNVDLGVSAEIQNLRKT